MAIFGPLVSIPDSMVRKGECEIADMRRLFSNEMADRTHEIGEVYDLQANRTGATGLFRPYSRCSLPPEACDRESPG